jgi:hypothetical protein
VPQYAPHCLIVGRCIYRRKIGPEHVDKVAHSARSKIFPGDVSGECRAVGKLPGPVQRLLAGLFYARGRPSNGSRQFIPTCFEFRLLSGLPYLGHDILEFFVGGREGQRALRLNFEDGVGTIGVRSLHHHVVQRTTRAALLKCNGPDCRPRETARLAT